MCWHYSHSKGRHVKGVNLLSCIVQYGDISLPIGYEIVHKDVKFSDIETKKEILLMYIISTAIVISQLACRMSGGTDTILVCTRSGVERFVFPFREGMLTPKILVAASISEGVTGQLCSKP